MAKSSIRSDIPSQAGRLAVVTGASGGLGFQTALALAAAGAEVVVAARSEQRGEQAAAEIRLQVPGSEGELRAARFGEPRLGRGIRVAPGGVPSVARAADQQCWRNGPVGAADHGGRVREAVRHELPRPFRSDRPAAAAAAARARCSRYQPRQRRPSARGDRLRRSPVGAELCAVARLRTIEARDADVRDGTAAAERFRRLGADQPRRASRLGAHRTSSPKAPATTAGQGCSGG